MSGPDGLHVRVVPTGTAYGCWARRYGIREDAVLLVTRRGAIVGVAAGPDDLARLVDLRTLAADGAR